MDLLPGQLEALRNLARKQAGEDVAFINIAHARALTEYKRALEIDPNNNYIRRNYARFAEFYTAYTKTTGKASGAP